MSLETEYVPKRKSSKKDLEITPLGEWQSLHQSQEKILQPQKI